MSRARFLGGVTAQPDSIFVVTAYDLRGKPLLAYRRRLRKKGR